MAKPALALLLAGKMAGHDDKMEEGDEPSNMDAKLDAVRHLIAAVHSKDEHGVLECLENLIELCKSDDDMDMKNEDKPKVEADDEEPSY